MADSSTDIIPPADAGLRSPRVLAAAFVLLGIVIAGMYRGLWNVGFYNDDYLWLAAARRIASQPASILVPDASNAEAVFRVTQRVLTTLVYSFFGTQAWAHHVWSLLLHTIASTAVFAFALELHLRWRSPSRELALFSAGLAALLFATAHNHAMAVMWISAQSGLLAAIFVCGLGIYLLRNVNRLDERRVRAVVVALFLLALLSKHTVAGLPVMLGLACWMLPSSSLSAVSRQQLRMLAIALGAVVAIQLLVAKFVIPRVAGIDSGENFALGAAFVGNLFGAMLAPFVSAKDLNAITGGSLSHEFVAIVALATFLGCARWLRIHGIVVWSVLWILVMALPIALLDYAQYDHVQFTVTRYYYVPMIGAVILYSAITREVLRRLPKLAPAYALLIITLCFHVLHHQGRIQSQMTQLSDRGQADQTVIDGTLAKARTMVRQGSTIYAVNWPTQNEYIVNIGDLFFESAGYHLFGSAELAEAIAAYDRSGEESAWVAEVDAESSRLGLMSLSLYVGRQSFAE